MRNAEDIENDLSQLVSQFSNAPDQRTAIEVLTFVHHHGEDVLQLALDQGFDLPSCRQYFERPTEQDDLRIEQE